MADLARRFPENPILRPSEICPSMPGMKIECLLNPGVFRFENKTWLLLRVAERPEQKPDQTSFPVLDESGGVKILEFDNADPQLDLSDPRVISYAGQDYLTTMSHLRLVASGDGMHFREPRPNPPIFGVGDLESYGIEDCRVVEIEGTYYLTFTQVSQHGVAAPGPGYICGAMLDAKANNGGCNQEWQFPEFTAFPSGADGDQMHNLLGRLGAQAIADAFRQENRRTLGLVRASHAWAAPVPMVIYSDEYDFPDYIRYNLSAGVQGLLWTPEVRDAGDQRDWTLRVSAAAFSARMLYNGWQFPHFPWQQPNLSANEHHQLLPDDNPFLKITRHFNRLRMMLVPYLYQAYSDSHRKGISPVRPLVADWPEDSNTWHLDDQWMLGADLLVAPLTNSNSFSNYRRQVVDDAKQFRPLNDPCRITTDGGAIELARDFDGLGIKGARTSLELQAGPCTLRFAYRTDAGSAGIRLWTPEGKELREFHVDDLPTAAGWQVGVIQTTIPTAGTYALYIGKAHASIGARHIAFRNIAVIERPPHQDAKTAWSREVYLPDGSWRDFWTGKILTGRQHLVVTATPERPPVFVREGTLLPLTEPLPAIDGHTIFTVHLAAYGENPRPCQLLEDDGLTLDYEKGNWATLTVRADGTIQCPNHGQSQRYRTVGTAKAPQALLEHLLTTQ